MAKKIPAIVVDVSDTLAVPSVGFHEFVRAELFEPVAELVRLCRLDGFTAILINNRASDPSDRPMVEYWLYWNQVGYDMLFMREDGDSRSADLINQDIYHNAIQLGYDVRFAVERRQNLVEMWERMGVSTFWVVQPPYLS